MGEVYRARDTKLGRDVAVKVLPDALAADPERIARFEREAKALASLNHDNIATLFGMEETDGRHFLIMELVEGETLAERIEGRKAQGSVLPLEVTLAIALQIAEGLEAAHEKGIVHRDLKPANVKITPDEKVKVLDFGLAKAMETEPSVSNLTHSPTLSMMATQAGVILGTAAYMSPEQAKGFPADHRSDVFSFGVVLYEMLTGRQPFEGDTAPDILASVLAREHALAPADIQAFFDRWSHRLPWPMTPGERAAGYDHRLAICQLEVSVTHVFDRPVQGRHFFEAVIRENLDLGRPDRVRLLFPLRLTRATPPPAFGYRTRVITDRVEPSLHVEYKSSHVKQYFKEQHALRTETTINNPMDFYVRKGLDNLSHLRELGQQVNRKLLEVERVSHHCVLTQDALDRLQRPTLEEGQRASALRFGDPRVMALFQALCAFTHLPHGFRNHDLRPTVEALLGRPYTRAQMTYDLRRLRLKGLIHRIPKTHRYTATSYGLKVAFFYAKLYLRILRPNWAALIPAADSLPHSLRTVLDQLDAEIHKLHQEAALAA